MKTYPFQRSQSTQDASRRSSTSTLDKLKRLVEKKLCTTPEDFDAHPTIKRILETKRKMFETGKGFDWSTAESLAFATLLEEGYPVRLVGQDSVRGTFSQRHSGLTDQTTGEKYFPLNNLSKKQAKAEIIDSLLSEVGVLGFEYGYSLVEPDTLVLWEAQFGDFANGAQIIIDQFITSGESKWRRASGLVLLLPHGYEGQGPEHSSARLERFLQLCAQDNIQVVNCTTPANYFHVLRRQMLREFRKPLIVMTPKSLLRHKQCVSIIDDFTKDTSFHRVLPDRAYSSEYNLIKLKNDNKIKKVIICSGKIYFDLVDAREKTKNDNVVFIRLEQIYPFPVKRLGKELKRYVKNADIYWCQEEPKNMGAWNTVNHYINRTLEIINFSNKNVEYIGRRPSASTATGNLNKHLAQQKEILEKVVGKII